MIALIGRAARRAVMKAASDTLKAVMLETGGDCADRLPDAYPDDVAEHGDWRHEPYLVRAIVGLDQPRFRHKSTRPCSAKVKTRIAHYRAHRHPIPQPPWARSSRKPSTSAILFHRKRKTGRRAAALRRRTTGRPVKGFFIEPTVFADVQPNMRIARRGDFRAGAWHLEQVNAVEYGLTASNSRPTTCRPHIAPPPRCRPASCGSTKWANTSSARRSGASNNPAVGREECFEEMLAYTQRRRSRAVEASEGLKGTINFSDADLQLERLVRNRMKHFVD